MSKKAALSLTALSLALGSAPVFAQSETAEGFIEGSTPVSYTHLTLPTTPYV